MPLSSRPYKSKLLRFVLQQWQQGLERQDRAWRQLQSTAVWGTQVAIFPIYVVMRAVERASFALGSGGSPPKSDKPVESMATAKDPRTAAKGHVTDIEHSLTAILTHTQQILSSEQREQLAIAPKSGIIRQARYLLTNVVEQIRQQLSGSFQSVGTSAAITKAQQRTGRLATAHKAQQQSGKIATSRTVAINRRVTSDLAQNGTTLASSLKTQKLVLVNLKNEVFDIFTPEQQADLNHYIAQIIHAYQQSRTQSKTIVSRQPKRLAVNPTLAIAGNATDIEQSLTAILGHTRQLLSSEPKRQLTIAPKGNFIRQAKSFLSNIVKQIQPQQLSDSLQSTVQKPGGLTTGRTADINHRVTSDLAQNGATLASSLKTQKLVVVNLKNEVFDIFTPEQQVDLQHYIAQVMHAYQQSRTQSKTIEFQQPKRLSVKTILAITGVFMAALPMEFRKAWSQIALGPKKPELPHIAINSAPDQPSSRMFHPQSSTSGTIKTPTQRLSSNTHTNARRLSSNSPDAFEASVNSISYLEHPLERILRWIDRILTWCERVWYKLINRRN